jgi:hypothetical protein
MSGYVWDLSGTDHRCCSYAWGHLVHYIQFKHSMQEPSPVITVTARIDDEEMIHIEGDDVSLVGWNHRPALVREALRRFDGVAVWKSRWHLLAVPTDSFWGSVRSVFSIALNQRSDCHVTRVTNPDHVEPKAAPPTNVPPLRIAARYADGKPTRRRRE